MYLIGSSFLNHKLLLMKKILTVFVTILTAVGKLIYVIVFGRTKSANSDQMKNYVAILDF